jgi:Undecaprenyl-phosphate galactose phosphotransferase WbaP
MATQASSGDAGFAFPPAPVLASNAPLRYEPQPSRTRQIGLALKRGFDVVAALMALLILSPILPLVALVVRLDGGPVLYGHTRIGRKGQSFKCLKFRTMVVDADKMLAHYLETHPRAAMEWARQQKLRHDPRVTRIGTILRKTSIDELPQLINVLRGEMSLVGPRPVVHDELDEHYGPVGSIAYSAMRPGITGLWQVSGRSDTTYRERVTLDITYRSNWSFLLDLKILLRTIPVVLGRRGAV